MLDNFEILEEPTEDVLGSFQCRLIPNCGDEEAGCQIDLIVNYRDEFPQADYKLLEESADGLNED